MMDITPKQIKVIDLISGYQNDPDKGVRGYGGRLDIRPPYQREFRYNDKQKEDVIHTILKVDKLQCKNLVFGKPCAVTDQVDVHTPVL